MKNRLISIFLALAMLLTIGTLNVFSAFAADAGCVTVSGEAPVSVEVTAGDQYTLALSAVFQDSGGHSLNYTLGGDVSSEHSKISDNTLYFTAKDAGTYTVVLNATCSEGGSATHTMTVTVKAADHGLDEQYNYDETPADAVTVYVTLSNDGIPLTGADGTVLSHLKVTVPYFDLALYNLESFYRYHTENGEGNYVDDVVVERPTGLHLYLYLLERYYMGIPEEDCCKGTSGVMDYFASDDVRYLDGTLAYTSYANALTITGSATSLYMSNFWGHDENLMYYRNHCYPYMSPGWGATSDYILLSDGDTWDVAMFTNWDFYHGGGFICFDQDEYAADAGTSLEGNILRYGTTYEASNFFPHSELDVYLYDADWNEIMQLKTADDGEASFTFTVPEEPGTYYLLGMDPNRDSDSAKYAPATAILTVTSDPYADYLFDSVTCDTTDQLLTVIDASTCYVDHYSNPSEKPFYTITIPEGAQTVTVRYPAGAVEDLLEYVALFDPETGAVDWNFWQDLDFTVTYTTNADNSVSVTLPAAFLIENKLAIALEAGSDFEYFNTFSFVYGDISGKPGTVAVSGVTLDQSSLSLERRTTAQLTAQIRPEDASNQRVSWSSSDTAVASVDKNGLVTAVGEGKAVITVTTADGGFTADCTVTVTDPNRPKQDEDGTYLIETAAELQWFAVEVNSGESAISAKLTEDIDLSSVCGAELGSWKPIGDYSCNTNGYQGTFDGQNHRITNLYINENFSNYNNTSMYYRGLFGYLEDATVKNLSLYGSVVSNCRYVAALAGELRSGSIVNCHNYATVTCTQDKNEFAYAGIVAGSFGSVVDCSNHAKITGSDGWVGGIVGYAYSNVEISGCFNEGEIYCNGTYGGYTGVGGIVGRAQYSITITNCYNTGSVYQQTVSASEVKAGGILGWEHMGKAELTNCYNTGLVDCSDAAKEVTGTEINGVAGASSTSGYTSTSVNCYYLDSTAAVDGTGASAVSKATLGSLDLGDGWQMSCPSPVLSWQEPVDHTDADGDNFCDVCGTGMSHAPELGDIDGDGTVSSTDAALIYRAANGNGELTGEQLSAADVNGDGIVNSTDAALIYRYANGKIDHFPADNG